MKYPTALLTAIIFSGAGPARSLSAADNGKSFEGIVSASLTVAGAPPTRFLFTRQGNQLRVEAADKSKPEPINIVDLATHKLTIVYPHNSSFVVVDLTKAPAQPGAPNLPPGFPAPPNMNSVGEAAGFPGTTASSPTVQKISPPPGFPTPPPMPSMPSLPNNSGASGIPQMPAMPNPAAAGPMMPPMPAMRPGGAPELKKTDKTRKIQGFECTCYTISDRMETFEIWATPDSALFPFRLLERNYNNRHFGPVMLEEQWGELLQKKSLFPLEATLRMENGGPERFSFKADKIENKKIDDAKLFQVPEGFYQIDARPF